MWGLCALALAAVAQAEDLSTSTATPAAAPSQTVDTVAAPGQSTSKLVGMIDMRPSWTMNLGEFHNEGVVEVGWQFNPNLILSSWVEFTTNILNNRAPLEEQGLNPTLGATIVRTRVNHLYDNAAKDFWISYENRTYLPTATASRDRGMIAVSRNYLKLNKKVSNSVTLMLYDILIPQIYARAGSGKSANPAFENRVYAMVSWDITSRLNFLVPIMFHQTKYRDFAAGAANNDAWTFTLWTYPELDWALTDNFTIGLSYYSDNLIKSDLSGFDFAGLGKGVFQFVTIVSL